MFEFSVLNVMIGIFAVVGFAVICQIFAGIAYRAFKWIVSLVKFYRKYGNPKQIEQALETKFGDRRFVLVRYSFFIKGHELDKLCQRIQWIQQNIKEQVCFEINKEKDLDGLQELLVYFVNEKDAMAFKLAWSDGDDQGEDN